MESISSPMTAAPVFRDDFSLKKILRAFSIMSTTTVVAIFFSALTTKVLSLVAGAPGVALMGMFRNLGALVGGTLTLGYTNVIVQQVSVARTHQEVSRAINASLLLFVIQCVVAVLLAVLFGAWMAGNLLGHSPSHGEVLATQVVVLMSLVNIALQTVTSILRGQAALKWLTVIQLITAMSSLAMIYPLVKMGDVGLAINVASGSLIGALVGFYVVFKRNGFSFNLKEAEHSLRLLRATSLPSVLITVESLATLGALLAVQSLINRAYGLDPLGNYNAAMLIIDTGVLVLMSSVRAYFLPALGKMESETKKQEIFERMMAVLLILGIAGALFLIFASGFVIPILFSKKFEMAGDLLACFSLSLIGLVFMWSYNTFLLHKGEHLQYVVIDSIWAVCVFGSYFFASRYQVSMRWIPLCYVGSCTITGLLYALYATRKHGRGYLSRMNILITLAGSFLLVGALWTRS